jgi:hypothetical protein
MFEKNNRNWVAWQLGVLFDDIFFKDLIQFEYSWLDHRVYRHRFPINDYYSFGYPLGFWAGPHSKEILLFYQVNFKESDLKIKYSNCLRGELTNEMIINQYNNVYYERFSQFVEKKSTFELIYSKTIFNSLKIKLGVEYIDWKDEINHSKKKSFNISISNILD